MNETPKSPAVDPRPFTRPTALVTGATRGIGRETARLLAEQGVRVWIGARDPERGAAVAADLNAGLAAGSLAAAPPESPAESPAEAPAEAPAGSVREVQLDVTDQDSIARAMTVIEAEGGLDILVNNAGVLGPGFDVRPSATDPDGLRAVLETNLVGLVAVTNAALPLLRRSSPARVLNVSSELGALAFAATDQAPILLGYNAAKAAVNMATLMYARELADTDITVNAVSPGFCATDLNGFTGTASASDGARVVVSAALAAHPGSGELLTATGPLPR